MKWAVVAWVVLLGACKAQREGALLVVVNVAPDAVSKCLQLEISSNGSQRLSGPASVEGKKSISIGVAQGAFPATVGLRALGYVDANCQTRSQEESAGAMGTFDRESVPQVTLSLKRVLPRSETNCLNALDDDGDSKTDCQDSDCDLQLCTPSLRCIDAPRCEGGVCAGRLKVCTQPPTTCFAQTDSCSENVGECLYSVMPGNTCTDGDSCTVQDSCLDDGGCTGTPMSCSQNANSCLETVGACGDGGCLFSPKVDAGCDDGDSCTLEDSCAAGRCTGKRVNCVAPECQYHVGRCDPGGRCLFANQDAGSPCSAGLCSVGGACLATFPYRTTNFEVLQLVAPPSTPTILDCGETVIDTSGPQVPQPTNWCRSQPFNATLIRQGGIETLLVSMSSFTLAADAGLRLLGDKPVIFGVFGDATINGRIVASSGNSSTCLSGIGRDGSGINGKSGGSGAGFSQEGGAGGDGDVTVGPLGGSIEGNLTQSPLRSGCPGGRGGNSTRPPSPGGGGFQVSVGGTLSLRGVIAAPGSGGQGGLGGLADSAGNGGGSGGVIVLEANDLLATAGAVTANGGGGGEGGSASDSNGEGATGSDGLPASTSPANGGAGFVSNGGNGGFGGSASSSPGAGESSALNAGGGGGATGLVFFRGVRTCSVAPAVVLSPRFPTDAGCR